MYLFQKEKAMKKNGTLNKRKGSKFWQLEYTDWLTGRRIRRSLKTEDYEEARREMQRILVGNGGIEDLTLKEMLLLYQDKEANPRRRQALIEGRNYGYARAVHVAMAARKIEEMLDEHAPTLMEKRVCDISRLEIKTIRGIFVSVMGQRRIAQETFRIFKTFFSQAEDDGVVSQSFARAVKDIKYPVKKRCAIEFGTIAFLVRNIRPYVKERDWAIFTILATTGMRLGEVLALSEEQFFGDTLTINRNLKLIDEKGYGIGTPKCNVVRTIPVSRTTMDVIGTLRSDSDERRFFPCFTPEWGEGACKRIKEACKEHFPERFFEVENLTPHVLRHSLNTALLIEGVSPVLVQEYLGWKHQDLPVIQQNYTHFFVQALKPVCNAIDSMMDRKEEDGSVYRLG